jgi:hypothetical protein
MSQANVVMLFGGTGYSERRRISMREPAPTNNNIDLPIEPFNYGNKKKVIEGNLNNLFHI